MKLDTYSYSEAETAVVITETMTDAFHAPAKPPTLAHYEKFREQYGSAQLRNAVIDLSVKVEKAWAAVFDKEEDPSIITWDFEWIPEVLDYLADVTPCWLEAPYGTVEQAAYEAVKRLKTEEKSI